jgi:1-deoxy-D-xylulose-5-phosphate synthase
MIVSAPKDENELQHLLYSALQTNHPIAVRYPRGQGVGTTLESEFKYVPIGKGESIKPGSDAAIVAIGSTVQPSFEAAQELAKFNIDAAVINARFAKPIDSKLVLEIAARTGRLVTVEENTLNGGFGSSILELLETSGLHNIGLKRIGIPDEFVEHGPPSVLRSKYQLDADGIAQCVLAFFPELAPVTVTGTEKPDQPDDNWS